MLISVFMYWACIQQNFPLWLRLQVPHTTIIWLGLVAPGPKEIENFGRAVAPGPLYSNNLAWSSLYLNVVI